MTKHCLRWKTIKSKNIRGADFDSNYPDIVNHSYRGLLLSRILAMPKGTAISFEQAILLAQEQFNKAANNRKLGYSPGQCHWYHTHFVEWISSLNYHIEITGDEFEPYVISDKLQ